MEKLYSEEEKNQLNSVSLAFSFYNTAIATKLCFGEFWVKSSRQLRD
jgi:hypothetical protein